MIGNNGWFTHVCHSAQDAELLPPVCHSAQDAELLPPVCHSALDAESSRAKSVFGD